VRPPLKGPFRKQIVVDLHQMKSMSDDFVEASKLAQSEQGRYLAQFRIQAGHASCSWTVKAEVSHGPQSVDDRQVGAINQAGFGC